MGLVPNSNIPERGMVKSDKYGVTNRISTYKPLLVNSSGCDYCCFLLNNSFIYLFILFMSLYCIISLLLKIKRY